MKPFIAGLIFLLILLAACSSSTAPDVTLNQAPTSTGETIPFASPTLKPAAESSQLPEITPIATGLSRPELSWQTVFDMRLNLTSERATLGKEGVIVDNLNYNDMNGMSSKAYALDGPFGIALRYGYQGSGYGSITLADRKNADPWWKDMRKVFVHFENNAIGLGFYDGTSEQAAGNIPLDGLDPKRLFYLIFPDPQGKQMIVLDDKGSTVKEIDITKLGNGALAGGLFPGRTLYAGFVITPHSQMTVYQLSLLAPQSSNLFQVYKTQELPTPTLRDLARQRGVTLGVEIDLADMEFYFDSRYQQTVASQFDAITTGYATSWAYAIHKTTPDFDWTKTDPVIKFVQQSGLKMAWDCIVFSSENTPQWLLNGSYSKDQILNFLQNHIQTVVPRFKGLVNDWGVVSEADWTGPTNKDQIPMFPAPVPGKLLGQFLNGKVGPDTWINDAFHWTKEAGANGMLTYINADNETLSPYSDFEYNFLKKMKQNGMPVDAIGFEMNLQASNFRSDADIQAWKDSVKQNMQRFGDLGLHVVIKELTVNVGNVEGKTREEKLDLQAKIYKSAVETCLESNGICTTIYLGGFTDTTSWLYYPSYPYGKAEAPNILDEYYHPKPAYFAIRDAFLGK